MRRSMYLLGSTVLLLLLAGCWPVPGQNPSRTSHNPSEKRLNVETVGDLQEVWRYGVPLADGDVRSPVVSDGQVFVTQRCTIAAVDAKTGQEEWYAAIPDQFETCGPDSQADTIAGEPHVISDPDGDRVVAGYGYMQVMPPGREETAWFGASFDVATGERSELSTGTAAAAWTPTVAGDVIYVTAGGSVHALAAEPCGEPTYSEVLWSDPGESSPVVTRGQVYTTVGESLVAYGVG